MTVSWFSQLSSIFESRRPPQPNDAPFCAFYYASGDKTEVMCGFKKGEVSWRFLGAHEKLRITFISFVMSASPFVCLSIGVKRLFFHWTDFCGIFYWERRFVKKHQFWLQSDNSIMNFTWRLKYVYDVAELFLGGDTFWIKLSREDQNISCHIYFSRKSCDVRDNNDEYTIKMQLACMPDN